jgi:hypothetical protein
MGPLAHALADGPALVPELRGKRLAGVGWSGSGMTARTTRRVMVTITVLSVVVAVAIPGYQTWLIIFGCLLVAWASVGLMTEE